MSLARRNESSRFGTRTSFDPAHTNLHAHADWIRSVHYSPDGRFVLSTSDDRASRIWDAKKGNAVSETVHHDLPVFASAFSPDRW